MASVKEVLEGARRELKTRGWVQGLLFSGRRCCSIGAVNLATANTGLEFLDQQAIRTRAISLLTNVTGAADCAISSTNAVANWNDAPDRTEEEVLAAFDAAIDIARYVK